VVQDKILIAGGGIGMAMEDAVCLADSLAKTDKLESGLTALRNAIMSAKSQAEWLDTLEWLYGGNGLG
jgi:hypothetical protein